MASETIYPYDDLFAGGVQQVVGVPGFITGGGVYQRGQVLALVSTKNGVHTTKPVDSTAAAPGNRVFAVLADIEVDTSAGQPVPCALYFSGEYNAKALKFQNTDKVDTFAAQMRDVGITVKYVL